MGLASSSASAGVRKWSTPVSLAASRMPVTYAISCASATVCVAVSGNGEVMTRHAGKWTVPHKVDAGGSFNDVSCVSTTFCVAIAAGNAVTYDGHSWSSAIAMGPRDDGYHLSCASRTFCAAVGANGVAGRPGVIATFDGRRWTRVALASSAAANDRFLSVSCASARWCVAANLDGQIVTFNGRRWSLSHPSGAADLVSVSCPSTTFCMAVSINGNAMTMNGSRWSTPRAIPHFANADAYSVSCASSSGCAVIGLSGRAVSWTSGRWSAPVDVFAHMSPGVDVSCATRATCVAVNDDAKSASS